jgi:DNA-binding transcriptional ArsR family regulator
MPANIAPKHEGHETVVSADPQYSQREASAFGAGAPQDGQLREKAMDPRMTSAGRTGHAVFSRAFRTSHPLRPTPPVFILNHMVQYAPRLDRAFGAIADPTRRGILSRLGRGDASITGLAEQFDMTLTGMKKHVRVLEDAGLVTTAKVGRVRTCALGPRRLDDERAWIEKYQQLLEQRFDRLEAFLEHTRGTGS